MPVLVALGFAGGLLHVLNHAFFKCQLFYAAGAVYQAAHTVDMERLGGLARLMPWTAASFLIGGVAISRCRRFNGFASEFVIYSGLFNVPGRCAVGAGGAGGVGALLAFVGAVSALSITRAFGVVFLGSPRDPPSPPVHEVSRWMLLPTLAHAAGVVVLGVFPVLGLRWWKARWSWRWPACRAPAGRPARCRRWASTLSRIGVVSGALTASSRCWRWRVLAQRGAAPAHVTWGCGYGAPNSRMQYTGSSFSWDFGRASTACWCCCAGRRRPKATSRPTATC
jgi:hydrogenase-4 component B